MGTRGSLAAESQLKVTRSCAAQSFEDSGNSDIHIQHASSSAFFLQANFLQVYSDDGIDMECMEEGG